MGKNAHSCLAKLPKRDNGERGVLLGRPFTQEAISVVGPPGREEQRRNRVGRGGAGMPRRHEKDLGDIFYLTCQFL